MFVHSVYFWLKDDAPADARDKLTADCVEILGRIPSVRHLWAGGPAGTPREVVDNTYHVGVCVVLDDAAGHDVYQDHPLHKEFIQRNRAHWRKIQVYDFK